MDNKWTKEQIEWARKLIKNKGCGHRNESCFDVKCPFLNYEPYCPFSDEETTLPPCYENYNNIFDKNIRLLLQRHEHDTDEQEE